MHPLDWIFVGILTASLLIGAWRGLVFELLSLAGWVAAFFVAQWFAADVGRMLPIADADSALSYASGFAVVFIAAVFACGFIAWLAKKLVDAIGLRPADRVLGAGFGLARGGVLLLAVAVLVGLTPLRDEPWWTASLSAPVLSEVLGVLKPVLPQKFGSLLPLSE
ncbi:MAG: CvpA family protein [Acidovorax sp.]|jgi:membrane protein required for colicin V production|nr:CvpA family protein [Acidovorax sp.]